MFDAWLVTVWDDYQAIRREQSSIASGVEFASATDGCDSRQA
jgi:hypothetical protein